jgi:hypothetical protein
MRKKLSEKLEDGRVHSGLWTSERGDLFGAFLIQGPCGRKLKIITSGPGDTEFGWEHVSVSGERHPPNWEEMCFVKDLFWEDEECVMQLHPPKSNYVNYHPHCLHLWRPIDGFIPTPDSALVGPPTPDSVLGSKT